MEDNFKNDSSKLNQNSHNDDYSKDGKPSTFNILARDSDLAPAIRKEVRLAHDSSEGFSNRQGADSQSSSQMGASQNQINLSPSKYKKFYQIKEDLRSG